MRVTNALHRCHVEPNLHPDTDEFVDCGHALLHCTGMFADWMCSASLMAPPLTFPAGPICWCTR
jgi:hypothetical protein